MRLHRRSEGDACLSAAACMCSSAAMNLQQPRLVACWDKRMRAITCCSASRMRQLRYEPACGGGGASGPAAGGTCGSLQCRETHTSSQNSRGAGMARACSSTRQGCRRHGGSAAGSSSQRRRGGRLCFFPLVRSPALHILALLVTAREVSMDSATGLACDSCFRDEHIVSKHA